MTSWVARRYAVRLIDDELDRLRVLKLDTSPADPRRPALLARIDWLLDQRLDNRTRGNDGPPQQ
jgi:hypothetical protein